MRASRRLKLNLNIPKWLWACRNSEDTAHLAAPLTKSRKAKKTSAYLAHQGYLLKSEANFRVSVLMTILINLFLSWDHLSFFVVLVHWLTMVQFWLFANFQPLTEQLGSVDCRTVLWLLERLEEGQTLYSTIIQYCAGVLEENQMVQG